MSEGLTGLGGLAQHRAQTATGALLRDWQAGVAKEVTSWDGSDPLERSRFSLVQSKSLTMSGTLWSHRSSPSLAQPVSSATALFVACMNMDVPCGSRRDTQVRPERCSGPTIRDFGRSMVIFDPGNQWPMRSLALAEW